MFRYVQYIKSRILKSTQNLLCRSWFIPILSIFSDIGKVAHNGVCHNFGVELRRGELRMS